MPLQFNHRGIVAIVLSVALGIVLVVLVSAAASGVAFTEVGRSAAWALVGALAGSLITYLTAAPKNGNAPPPAPK